MTFNYTMCKSNESSEIQKKKPGSCCFPASKLSYNQLKI